MSLSLRLFWISACVGCMLCAPSAQASSVYPAEIQTVLGLSAAPPCTICHLSDEGGKTTAVKPFAVTMRGFGLVGDSNLPALRAALAKAAANKPDSDFDGVDDLSELVAGQDPNDGVDLPTPQTGCALAAATARAPASFALGSVLVAALLAVARYTNSRRRAPR